MTKQEFIIRHKAAQRAETRRLFVTCVLGYGIGGAAVFGLVRRSGDIAEWISHHWTAASFQEWVMGVSGLLLVLFAIAIKRLREPAGVECPSCGRHLQSVSVFLALMTGNCGYCGKKVVEDCNGKPESAGPLLPS